MDIDISEVKLPDAAFWATAPHDPGLDPIPRKYKTSHFGVIIDGPTSVAINERDTLPFFAYYMGSYQQISTRDFPHAAHIVAVDPVNNQLYTAPFVRKRGETILSPERTPASELPEGYLMTFQKFDAKDRLELPWKPGRLITQVILFDLVSNRIETKLATGADSFVDPEKEKFLAAERAKQDPPAPFPAKQLAASDSDLEPVPVPEGFGVAISAPRVAVLEGSKPLPLNGAWRLPVRPEEQVKPAHAEVNRTRRLIQEDGATPYAACVAVHLLVVASGEEFPLTYTLQLPVAKLTEQDGTLVASGTFSFDLRQLPQFPTADQTLIVYAFAKDWASAPATIGIIDRQKQ